MYALCKHKKRSKLNNSVLDLQMSGQVFHNVEVEKLLGIQIDYAITSLKFSGRLNSVCKVLTYTLFTFYMQNFSQWKQESFSINAYISPTINYCLSILGNAFLYGTNL